MKKLDFNKIFIPFTKRNISKKAGWNLAILLCLEIICMSVLTVFALVKPRAQARYAAADLLSADFENVSKDGSDIVFSPDESISKEEPQKVSGGKFSLPSGGYRIDISYRLEESGNRNYTLSTGSLTVVSDHHELEAETVKLDNGHRKTTGRFWIPAFSRCEDLRLSVEYKGGGVLRIQELSVSESMKYRAVRLLAFLLVFALIDALYLIFFTDYPVKWNKTVIAIGLIALAASMPFLDHVLYYGHDLWFHLRRIMAISQGLSHGQFPVRIATELNNGYGYASPLYYCDIFLYLSGILYSLHVPLRICYQLYVITVNIVTGIFTYYAISGFTKKWRVRMVGTMLYMLCTYRLVNLNIRAAAGEFTAMCFLPLIVVGLHGIFTKKEVTTADWFALAVGMAGAIMSHIVTVEMLVINIAMLCVAAFSRLLSIKRIMAAIKAALTGALMTAWFWIPFLDSARSQTTLVQSEDLRMLGDTTQTWATILNLFAPGDGDHFKSLGAATVLCIALMVYCLLTCKRTAASSDLQREKITEFRILCLFAFVNILFASRWFPWNRIQNLLGINGFGYLLGTIQFAWRFFAIAAILIAVATVIALDFISDTKPRLYKISLIAITASIVFGCGFFYYRYINDVEGKPQSNLPSYANTDTLYWLKGTGSDACNVSKCRIKEGEVEIVDYHKTNGVATLSVKNLSDKQEAKMTVPIFAYQNYRVDEMRDDTVGKEIAHGKDENNYILITVPAGFEGKMTIRFAEPVLWRVSEAISLITWIVIACVAVRKKKQESQKRRETPGEPNGVPVA